MVPGVWTIAGLSGWHLDTVDGSARGRQRAQEGTV